MWLQSMFAAPRGKTGSPALTIVCTTILISVCGAFSHDVGPSIRESEIVIINMRERATEAEVQHVIDRVKEAGIRRTSRVEKNAPSSLRSAVADAGMSWRLWRLRLAS